MRDPEHREPRHVAPLTGDESVLISLQGFKMTTNVDLSDPSAFANATDAFMAISSTYMDCTARLAWHALVFSRETVEECLTTYSDLTSAKNTIVPLVAPYALARSLMEHALENTRSGCDAVIKAHRHSAQIIVGQVATPASAVPDADA